MLARSILLGGVVFAAACAHRPAPVPDHLPVAISVETRGSVPAELAAFAFAQAAGPMFGCYLTSESRWQSSLLRADVTLAADGSLLALEIDAKAPFDGDELDLCLKSALEWVEFPESPTGGQIIWRAETWPDEPSRQIAYFSGIAPDELLCEPATCATGPRGMIIKRYRY